MVGTLALLLVSGGIFEHNIEYLHHFLTEWPALIKEFILGLLGGILVLVLIAVVKVIISKFRKKNT